jgi:phosphoribosylaminoimidazole carboxylase
MIEVQCSAELWTMSRQWTVRFHWSKFQLIWYILAEIFPGEELIAPLVHLADNMRAERKDLPLSTPSSTTSGRIQPLIAVTMGADSDLPVLKLGLELLETLGIPFHFIITSAHHTPLHTTEFASSAVANDFRVIIAGVGCAGHLPGMVAASTPLPVIRVAIKDSTLDRIDSLLSIVCMPRSVSVATVAINNSVSFPLFWSTLQRLNN